MKLLTKGGLATLFAAGLVGATNPVESTNKQIGGETLVLNGSGVHTRYSFRVYELFLFVKERTSDPEVLIASNDLRYAKMKFLRNVNAKEIRDGFRISYNESCKDVCAKNISSLEILQKAIPNMKKGETFEFTFYPDKLALLVHGRKEINIPGSEFGRILLRTWVGTRPPSKKLKKSLLGI